jgi:hypothetical protein
VVSQSDAFLTYRKKEGTSAAFRTVSIVRMVALTRRKHSGRIIIAPPPGCTSQSAIMEW